MIPIAEVTLPDLPKWVLYFSFVASLILTLLKVASSFKQPALDLKLTPELFFRVSDFGECLFCNPIYMAWNGPVLILNATADLEKMGTNTRKCRFRIAQFGEKMKGGNSVNPDFYFHSPSPIQHVDEGKPQRVLYLLVEESQETKVKKAFAQAAADAIKVPEAARSQFPGPLTSDQDKQAAVDWILAEQDKVISQAVTSIMDCVQLEGGHYELAVTVEYLNPKARFLRPSNRLLKWLLCRKATGKVAFTVDDALKDLYRSQLNSGLRVMVNNIIANKTDPFAYPQYFPQQIVSL